LFSQLFVRAPNAYAQAAGSLDGTILSLVWAHNDIEAVDFEAHRAIVMGAMAEDLDLPSWVAILCA
jgi:hypothetical protein